MNTEQQIPLNLPSTSTSTAKSIEPIIITLTTSHKLYIDNREISADNLSQEVQDIVRTTPRHAFVICASKDVYYSEVIALLDMLKVNGAKYISVATDRKWFYVWIPLFSTVFDIPVYQYPYDNVDGNVIVGVNTSRIVEDSVPPNVRAEAIRIIKTSSSIINKRGQVVSLAIPVVLGQ